MNIRWFGHSSFLLTSQEGVRILMDPYDHFMGYRMPSLKADIVAVSHDHIDHNRVQIVTGDYLLVNKAAEYSKGGVTIRGIKTFHDDMNGAKRGDNIVFVFRVEGLVVCHCGDLGHTLSDEQLKEIGRVDILMIPVGGTRLNHALDGKKAVRVISQIKPAITIPMHYRTKALGLAGFICGKLEKFLEAAGQASSNLKELDITKEKLSETSGIVVLQYE